jgi:glycosyltransferase involved in cell wall biosynthesis
MPFDVPRRVLIDVSTTVRWSGPPVGIVRVERALAAWAHDHRPNTAFVIFDPDDLVYREIPRAANALISGAATLDTFGLRDPADPARHRSDIIPEALRPASLWLLQFRRSALHVIEEVRLQTSSQRAAALCDRLQRAIMKDKDRKLMIGPDGKRRALVRIDRVAGDAVALTAGDTLIAAGAGWAHCNIDALAEAKRRAGFRFVLLVHDLIPIQFPHFYKAHDAAAFSHYMRKAIPLADLIITGAQRVADDVRRYGEENGLTVGTIALSPFGADPVTRRASSILPEALAPGRYALLVSTIEPRKGHALIYETWLRLLAAGVPQAANFKLVFVGRPGWMVESLLARIQADPNFGKNLLIFENVDDDDLATLYDGAAFCLYPSVYEGYGLPIVEAFFHGKAVLASTGGAIPEMVGRLSPCIDPADSDGWYRALKTWIEDPSMREPYERAILEQFRHPTWNEAAASFFARAAG